MVLYRLYRGCLSRQIGLLSFEKCKKNYCPEYIFKLTHVLESIKKVFESKNKLHNLIVKESNDSWDVERRSSFMFVSPYLESFA